VIYLDISNNYIVKKLKKTSKAHWYHGEEEKQSLKMHTPRRRITWEQVLHKTGKRERESERGKKEKDVVDKSKAQNDTLGISLDKHSKMEFRGPDSNA
jgi:hypothetical protein